MRVTRKVNTNSHVERALDSLLVTVPNCWDKRYYIRGKRKCSGESRIKQNQQPTSEFAVDHTGERRWRRCVNLKVSVDEPVDAHLTLFSTLAKCTLARPLSPTINVYENCINARAGQRLLRTRRVNSAGLCSSVLCLKADLRLPLCRVVRFPWKSRKAPQSSLSHDFVCVLLRRLLASDSSLRFPGEICLLLLWPVASNKSKPRRQPDGLVRCGAPEALRWNDFWEMERHARFNIHEQRETQSFLYHFVPRTWIIIFDFDGSLRMLYVYTLSQKLGTIRIVVLRDIKKL